MGDYPYYATTADLIDRADLVVRATLTSTRPGALHPERPTGADPALNPQAGVTDAASGVTEAMDVTIATVRVDEVLKGGVSPGQSIDVVQPGDASAGTPPPGVTYIEDETVEYLLVLASFPSGAALLNPTQALYTVAPDGTLTPVDPDGTVLTTLDEARALVTDDPT
ncbi:hypothetical protein N869_15920 [Cellulomonas bogoriensis 69B4 = DSM 16987]|uniref:Uncharacterized protein n=2 Tax=Cellulomonas bogoriensis TaxID=301388 RepID=A0A0A0C197_9CELL|nr:hypothetical protein N869_15920 [Cellulomonas bogoriensis 69B4 = DSM 16987]